LVPPEESKPQRKILDRLHDFLEEQPPAYAACAWEIRKAVDEGWARAAVADKNRKANLLLLGIARAVFWKPEESAKSADAAADEELL
jgi:hypothetical protein